MIIDNERMTDSKYIKYLEGIIRSMYSDISGVRRGLHDILTSNKSVSDKVEGSLDILESLSDMKNKWKP